VLAGKPINSELNVCSGTTCSVKDIVAVVQKCVGTNIEPIYRDPALLWEKSVKLWQGARPFPRERMKEEVENLALAPARKLSACLVGDHSTQYSLESQNSCACGKQKYERVFSSSYISIFILLQTN